MPTNDERPLLMLRAGPESDGAQPNRNPEGPSPISAPLSVDDLPPSSLHCVGVLSGNPLTSPDQRGIDVSTYSDGPPHRTAGPTVDASVAAAERERQRRRAARAAPRSSRDVAAASRGLDLLLAPSGAGHLVGALAAAGWSAEGLGDLEEADLGPLRITGRTDRKAVMAAAAAMRAEALLSPAERLRMQRAREARSGSAFGSRPTSAASSRPRAPRAGRAAGTVPKADTSTLTPGMDVLEELVGAVEDDASASPSKRGGAGGVGSSEFTATLATANEHARQATIFLEHQRLDRAWPSAHSKLSRALNLSHTAPCDEKAPLYTIRLGSEGSPTAVHPPEAHGQGFQAKFCPTCSDFVAEAYPGKWQYLAERRIVTGAGEAEVMALWTDFAPSESVRIEHAKKHMNPTVKIRRTLVNFKAMQWGPHRPVRRVNATSVPFPSLGRRDVEVPAEDGSDAANGALQASMDALARALVSDAEESRNRTAIEQAESQALGALLAASAAAVAEMFAAQLSALEAAEAAARAAIEGPAFDGALEGLRRYEADSLRRAEVKRWENNSAAIHAQQHALLADMEANKRAVIAEEEGVARRNLQRLLAKYNDEVLHMLAARAERAGGKGRGGGKDGGRRGDGSSLDGRRCPVCRKTNCTFFHQPWRGRWRERGGALDLQPPRGDGYADLNALVNTANAHEYEEDERTRRALRRDRKAQRRLMALLSGGGSTVKSIKQPPRAEEESAAMGAKSSLLRRDNEAVGIEGLATNAVPPQPRGGHAAAQESIEREREGGEEGGRIMAEEGGGQLGSPSSSRPMRRLRSALDASAAAEEGDAVMFGGGATVGQATSRRPTTAPSHRAASAAHQTNRSVGSVSFASQQQQRGGAWVPPRPSSSAGRPFLPVGGGSAAVTAFSATRSTKRTSSATSAAARAK